MAREQAASLEDKMEMNTVVQLAYYWVDLKENEKEFL